MNKVLLMSVASVLLAFPYLNTQAQDEAAAPDQAAQADDGGGAPQDNADNGQGANADTVYEKFFIRTDGSLQTAGCLPSQKLDFGKDHTYFMVSGNFGIDATATAKNGVKCSAVIEMQADSSLGQQCQSVVKSAYLEFEGPFGTVDLGNQYSAADELSKDGTSVLGGQEGPAGSLQNVYNTSAGALLSTGVLSDDGNATKIVWLSPTVKGFQAGLSYTPNSQMIGSLPNVTNISWQFYMAPYITAGNLSAAYDSASIDSTLEQNKSNLDANGKLDAGNTKGSSNTKPAAKDDLSAKSFIVDGTTGGITYSYGADDKFNASIAVCGWFGKVKPPMPDPAFKINNVSAYQVGGSIGYGPFKFGAGLADNRKSMMTKTTITTTVGTDSSGNPTVEDGIGDGAEMGKVYTVGASFTKGKIKGSIGYMYSIRKYGKTTVTKVDLGKSTAKVLTLAGDYNFMEGLDFYAEFDHVKTTTCPVSEQRQWAQNTNAPFGDNSGKFVFIGAKTTF